MKKFNVSQAESVFRSYALLKAGVVKGTNERLYHKRHIVKRVLGIDPFGLSRNEIRTLYSKAIWTMYDEFKRVKPRSVLPNRAYFMIRNSCLNIGTYDKTVMREYIRLRLLAYGLKTDLDRRVALFV